MWILVMFACGAPAPADEDPVAACDAFVEDFCAVQVACDPAATLEACRLQVRAAGTDCGCAIGFGETWDDCLDETAALECADLEGEDVVVLPSCEHQILLDPEC